MKPALLFLLASLIILATTVYYVRYQTAASAEPVRITQGPDYDKPAVRAPKPKAALTSQSNEDRHPIIDIKSSSCAALGFGGDVICTSYGTIYPKSGRPILVMLACNKAFATCQLLHAGRFTWAILEGKDFPEECGGPAAGYLGMYAHDPVCAVLDARPFETVFVLGWLRIGEAQQ